MTVQFCEFAENHSTGYLMVLSFATKVVASDAEAVYIFLKQSKDI